MNRILLIGIEPTLVDFSTMPDLDAAKVATLDAVLRWAAPPAAVH